MNQVNKEHQDWAKQRETEAQQAREKRMARLKTVIRVVAAVSVGILLTSVLNSGLALAPTIALVWLALVWPRAFPNTQMELHGTRAGMLYRWTAGPAFRAIAKRAFWHQDLKGKVIPLLMGFGTWWGEGQGDNKSLNDLIADKDWLARFGNDLPDLRRLGKDQAYATSRFRKTAIKRYIPLLLADLVWHLLIVSQEPHLTIWAILMAGVTGYLAWPIARAGACGRVDHYMASYARLAQFIELQIEHDDSGQTSLTAEQLAVLTKAPQ